VASSAPGGIDMSPSHGEGSKQGIESVPIPLTSTIVMNANVAK
jgi:hypothetical protein